MAEMEEDNDPHNMLVVFVLRQLSAARPFRLHLSLR